MDPSLYRAATEGNLDVLREKEDELAVQLTPNKNTVLHVAAQYHDIGDFAKEILKMQPSLLCGVNSKGETALHIAARKGHSNTVEVLIACAKATEEGSNTVKMLWMTNEDRDTALHEAVRNNHLDVVKLLIQEVPEFSHAANNSNETPLYLAAERDYHEIVATILKTCKSPAHSGPKGRTALHAAVFSGCLACTEELLAWQPKLTKEADVYGWTPLHCAARRNFVQCARLLLNEDKSTAYRDNKITPLHLAAREGHVEAMEELLSHCPDCWEMVNDRAQNILHIAVENEKHNVIKFILKNSWLSNLLNQKDIDGNTPLHILVASDCDRSTLLNLVCHPAADKGAFNRADSTPLDIASSTDRMRCRDDIIEELKKVHAPWGWRNIFCKDYDRTAYGQKARAEDKKDMQVDLVKPAETNMLVAALIATVTISAVFAVAGWLLWQ